MASVAHNLITPINSSINLIDLMGQLESIKYDLKVINIRY